VVVSHGSLCSEWSTPGRWCFGAKKADLSTPLVSLSRDGSGRDDER
jgi:hypothetical protein